MLCLLGDYLFCPTAGVQELGYENMFLFVESGGYEGLA